MYLDIRYIITIVIRINIIIAIILPPSLVFLIWINEIIEKINESTNNIRSKLMMPYAGISDIR